MKCERDIKLRIRGILRDWNADIVYLLETKIEYISREVICSLWGCEHVVWSYLGSRGASRGISLMWDRGNLRKNPCWGLELRNFGNNFFTTVIRLGATIALADYLN